MSAPVDDMTAGDWIELAPGLKVKVTAVTALADGSLQVDYHHGVRNRFNRVDTHTLILSEEPRR